MASKLQSNQSPAVRRSLNNININNTNLEDNISTFKQSKHKKLESIMHDGRNEHEKLRDMYKIKHPSMLQAEYMKYSE